MYSTWSNDFVITVLDRNRRDGAYSCLAAWSVRFAFSRPYTYYDTSRHPHCLLSLNLALKIFLLLSLFVRRSSWHYGCIIGHMLMCPNLVQVSKRTFIIPKFWCIILFFLLAFSIGRRLLLIRLFNRFSSLSALRT